MYSPTRAKSYHNTTSLPHLGGSSGEPPRQDPGPVHHRGPAPGLQDWLPASLAPQASHLQHAISQGASRNYTAYIEDELRKSRFLGPFHNSHSQNLHLNRFGVIPKGHNTGKWRLITDLSYPESASVNDGIDPSLCSLKYILVDMISQTIVRLGKGGTLLAKVDIEAAYRLVPVHPQDTQLQAVKWNDRVYVDPMLPFGLRSAPKIFNAIADALE